MAETEGRKPAEDSKLPDPKVWKWCKHPQCMEQAQQLEGFREENEQTSMVEHPELCAIFLEYYCWRHLSIKMRSVYKAKIEKWVLDGGILEEANLFGVTLLGVNLSDANLQRANLSKAHLQKASLWNTKLQKANLTEANLQEATLMLANLQQADLALANLKEAELGGVNLQQAELARADLQQAELYRANLQKACLRWANLQLTNFRKANLQEADLKGANLREANLSEANLQKADFMDSNLHECCMYGALLDDARYLTWRQVECTGEEKHEYWVGAEDAYRRLKNYFHQQGLYEDESQAYYREKLMAKRQAWEEKKLGKWFVLFLLNILAGYGEKLWRTVVSAFATILIFSGIYWLAGKLVTNGGEPITKFWHCLYFSVVTFATLGFGDISPALHSTGTQVAAVIEVILGYVFLGMLITIIARKFGR